MWKFCHHFEILNNKFFLNRSEISKIDIFIIFLSYYHISNCEIQYGKNLILLTKCYISNFIVNFGWKAYWMTRLLSSIKSHKTKYTQLKNIFEIIDGC